LQEQLRVSVSADDFIERVIRCGSESGFHFSHEDVMEAIHAGRRSWLERWI
jgi:hypothetical protein